MDVGWNHKLIDDQKANPVVFATEVKLPNGVIFPTEQHMQKIFKTESFKAKAGRLKTWGRSKGSDGKVLYEDDPHWIAVRNGTPLHMDPPYPRYSHHLKIRVDEGIFVRGLDKVELKLTTGTFYILDTHSPHQVFNKSPIDGWNIAVSIDSYKKWEPQKAINTCIDFALSNSFSS